MTKAKMNKIMHCAMKSKTTVKKIIHSVEKFIVKCDHEYKLSGLYIMDMIVRTFKKKYKLEFKIMQDRFGKGLPQIIDAVWEGTKYDEVASQKVKKVLGIWHKESIFLPSAMQSCDKIIDLSSFVEPAKPKKNKKPDMTSEVQQALLTGDAAKLAKLAKELGDEDLELLQGMITDKLGIDSHNNNNKLPPPSWAKNDSFEKEPSPEYEAPPSPTSDNEIPVVKKNR